MSKKVKFLISSVAFLLALSLTLGLVLFLPKKEEKPTVQPPQESRGSVPIHAEIVSADAITGASDAPITDKGGIMHLVSGAKFVMNGGTLANHRAKYGGAVYVSSGATFIMNAGTISGCVSDYGGAIYVEDGGFCYINGGNITGNTSKSAAIYVESGGTVEMADSAIVHDNIKLEPTYINVYVDGVLTETKTLYADTYTIVEADMPLQYEECCGYFLNEELTKTIKNDTIDLSNGDVNIYTKTASAASNFTFTKDTANGVYTVKASSTSISGEIVIPKEYNNLPVVLADVHFVFGYFVEAITLPASTTIIPESCFEGTSLSIINIPDSVVSIGDYAFSSSSLSHITIPDSVISIGSYAFSAPTLLSICVEEGNSVYDSRNNCNAIIETSTGILIQGCNNTDLSQTTGITSIGNYAFESCDGLTSIEIPDSVESIGSGAFYNCRVLTSIETPDSVESIGDWTFYYCTGLTSITIGNSVERIGESAFEGCSGLTSIEIPNSVTSIGSGAFSGCSGLTSVEIPDSVTSIGDSTFSRCSGLRSVTIGNSLESIGSGAFSGCSGLTSVTIGNSVESIGESAFEYCSWLTSIEIPNSVTSIGSYAFSYCTGLTSVTIGNSVTSIGSSAFFYCGGLTSIEIPDSVTSIGSDAFYYCFGLRSVTIGNSVTSIGSGAFYLCSWLTSIYIPTSVTTISASSAGYSPFYSCSSTMVIYCGAASKPTGWGTYWNYYNSSGKLQVVWGKTRAQYEAAIAPAVNINVYVDGELSKTIEAKGYTYIIAEADMPLSYEECCGYFLNEELTKTIKNDTIDLTNGSVNIYTKTATNSNYFTFKLNNASDIYEIVDTSITSRDVVIPKEYNGKQVSLSTKDLSWEVGPEEVGCVFYSCNINSVTLPAGMTELQSFIFKFPMQINTTITAISIPDSVTSIGDFAFSSCSGLTSIEIPDSVESIGERAFSYCDGLTSIYIPSSVKTITASSGNSPFSGCSSTMVIYCGAASKPTGWSTYWNYSLTVKWGYTRAQYEAAIGANAFAPFTELMNENVEVFRLNEAVLANDLILVKRKFL